MSSPRARAAARLVVLCAACAPLAAPTAARASAQVSASGQVGIVGVGEDSYWTRTKLDLGLRVEDVWLRERPTDFGIGPYVEARTAAFVYGDYGAGVVAILPIDQTFPLWVGAGGFARRQDQTWAPGVNAFVAWGGRSFNYDSAYAMAYGVILDVRAHGGELPGVDTVLALSIDLEALALPWIFGINAVR